LLGTPDNGRWKIAPTEEVRAVRRKYRDGTLVLETEFETDSGKVAVIDCMPLRERAPDVLRIIEGRGGAVRMRSDLVIRFDYGSIVPWVRKVERGIRATAGPDTIFCRGDVPQHGENLHTIGEFTVSEGERRHLTLMWTPTHAPEPREKAWAEAWRSTEEWWQEWSARCTYEGPWRDAVIRSLITLKALTYQPTGGLVAAATTSLPEQLGGVRNWDYRYCWRRTLCTR